MKIQILKKDSSKSFSYLAGINRPINPAQVTKLATSINKMGVLRPVIVATISFLAGKSIKYIIDGQHLFNALLRNNLDIHYIEITIKDKTELVETIALLNASSKNWAQLDYVTAWSSVSEDYKKLLHYYNVYDFELRILGSILSSREASNSHISVAIKKGTFKIVAEHLNSKILDYLTDVLTILPRMNRFDNRYVCSEYTNFVRSNMNDYNHKHFIENLKKE